MEISNTQIFLAGFYIATLLGILLGYWYWVAITPVIAWVLKRYVYDKWLKDKINNYIKTH